MVKKKETNKGIDDDELKSSEVREIEAQDFKAQINDLQAQIEYLKNIIQSQNSMMVNQRQEQLPKEYVVISMFNGILGLKTRPEQTAPAIMLHFKEAYTLRTESELQDFYIANRSAFMNRYLLFESPIAAEVLHIQDNMKDKFDIATYDNLGNLSLDALERVYRSCKTWQKDLILDKFVNESAKGNSIYYNPEKLALLEKLKNEEIPTIIWNSKNKQEEQSYVYNINDRITKTREVLSTK